MSVLKRVFAIMLCALVAGCASGKAAVLQHLLDTKPVGTQYAIRDMSEAAKDSSKSNPQMAEHGMIYEDDAFEDNWMLEANLKFNDMAKASLQGLQEAVKNDKLETTETEPDNSDQLLIFKLKDEEMVYLYTDGTLKTVDKDHNRTIYVPTDNLKKVASDAAAAIQDACDTWDALAAENE